MTDTERWTAVLAHDHQAKFLYGVTSTGVFCRPGCPSRRPSRRNVVFFDHPAEAERAGYRACKRCNPSGVDPATSLVEDLCRYMDAQGEQKTTLGELANFAEMSPFHLQRAFKSKLGISPRGYAKSRREAGAVRYSFADSPLGRMLLAETERGVCGLAFADTDTELAEWLAIQFPAANLEQGQPLLLEPALRLAAGEPVELPLDVRGTAFQARVWEALKTIPRGKTWTYEELAQNVGQPGAVRAVARACATNRIAVAIPCHRVIRKDGGLGGYRWGLDRKRNLLESEGCS